MNKYEKYIIQDLLPLYEEDLLSDETKEWLDLKLEEKQEYRQLLQKLQKPLEKGDIPEITDAEREKMFQKIHRKLTIYQFIFVAISFILAIQTALLNDSFGFILSYTVLGFVVYLFYSNMKMVFLLSFVPIFIWSVFAGIFGFSNEPVDQELSAFAYGFSVFQMALILSAIHYLFAFIGSLIALIFKKIKNEENIK